jgi:hypothetical protein
MRTFIRRCDRCGKSLRDGSIMSKFNTQQICLECKDKERAHPLYAEADRAETEAVRRGDYNFPGIGKPDDL